MGKTEFVDKYLRKTDGVEPRQGLGAWDVLTRTPGVVVGRGFEIVRDVEKRHLPKYSTHFMATGTAIGVDETGKGVHYYAARGLRFAGFLIAQTMERCAIQSRGSVFLKLEGVRPEDRGARVYCSAPNSFSLKPSDGGVEIGKVRFFEAKNRAAVAFRGEDDKRPLNLKLR